MYKICIPIFFGLALVACGDSSKQSPAPIVVDEPEEELTVTYTPTKTLTSTPEFLFESERDLSVVVSADSSFTSNQYISLCHLDSLGQPDYSNCLYTGTVGQSGFSKSFPIGNEVSTLAFVHWKDSASGISVVDKWQRNEGLEWLVYLTN